MSRPTVVCICGSTRFRDALLDATIRETLAGRIVLSIGVDTRGDEIFADMTESELDQVKALLNDLHLAKIDLADEILVLNVHGYVGQSTRREIEYAQAAGKPVRYLETAGVAAR